MQARMTKISKAHKTKAYRERSDLQARLSSLKDVIEFLRDSGLPDDMKKRMVNHAVWEITRARGNFTGEFRSRGVIEGSVGTKVQREHVYKRRRIVADILSRRASLDSVLSRVIHCVVTKEEHDRLSSVIETEDGWSRYKLAGVEVFRFREGRAEKYEA
jgi:hypothetical protein